MTEYLSLLDPYWKYVVAAIALLGGYFVIRFVVTSLKWTLLILLFVAIFIYFGFFFYQTFDHIPQTPEGESVPPTVANFGQMIQAKAWSLFESK